MAGIGKEGQRICIKGSDEFGNKEDCGNDKCSFQAATGRSADLMTVSVSVAVVVHKVDIIIGARGCYNTRFSRPCGEVLV